MPPDRKRPRSPLADARAAIVLAHITRLGVAYVGVRSDLYADAHGLSGLTPAQVDRAIDDLVSTGQIELSTARNEITARPTTKP